MGELDLALVGIGAHLPEADGPRAFWRNLRAGRESVRELSVDELRAAGASERELADPRYVRRAVVLERLEHFDAAFFGFGPKEGAILDPQHRHFLECAWEAFEDAGHPPERCAGAVGVFAGCGFGAYFAWHVLADRELVDSTGFFLLRHTGNDKDFLATRVSYCLDLKGPSVNVQTACSTSLVAVHLAAQSLLARECDWALAGGVTIELPHRRGYLAREGEILAPDGRCRAFDARAAGTVFGSGAACVLLRRLDDALADGDHVYAVLKGSAVNNDGAGKVGYLAPSVDGQAAAIAEALGVAGVEPGSLDYVEAHGTGTAMGDPIEVAALAAAFRGAPPGALPPGSCGLGSLKPNVGHLDTAAGVAGLIKVALALEHEELPPSLHFERPNPALGLESTPFRVVARLEPWPRGARPRRAGVNSLGVGGTNAHVVLEEAPAPAPSAPPRRGAQLVVLSARTRAALDEGTSALATHLREEPALPLADVAWTLAVGRRAFGERRVLAARDTAEAAELCASLDPRRVHAHATLAAPRAVLLFPGGGAQHARMAAGLVAADPLVRAEVERGIALHLRASGDDLRPLLLGPKERLAEADAALLRPSLQLPALFVVEHALFSLWRSLGLEPAALIGHSAGENVAACAAGVFSYEHALELVALRGRLFERVPRGGMLAVSLSEPELVPLLREGEPDGLDLAAVNAPELCVVSGADAPLDALARTLAARGVDARRVPIDIAAHSRLLEPILAEFRAFLESIPLAPPRIPLVSNRSGRVLRDDEATSPAYWSEHLRRTVRFADGLEHVLAGGERVLIECGPGRALSSLARQQAGFAPARHAALASLRHADEALDDELAFVGAFGRAWALGLPLAPEALQRGEARRRVSLPTYRFQRQRLWIEAAAASGGADEHARAADPARPERLPELAQWFARPMWRERALAAPQAREGTTRWLVFADALGLGEALAQRLRARGDEVALVEAADGFARLGAGRWSLAPEQGREGYDALVSDLAAHALLPQRVVHLWSVTDEERFRPGSSFFHRTQEQGFWSLVFLAQALAGEAGLGALQLTAVANGMQEVGGEGLRWPEKATLLGPVRVLPRELPGASARALELELPAELVSAAHARNGKRAGARRLARAALEQLAERLLKELDAPVRASTLAWRGERRYELEHEPVDAPAPSAPPWREGGVYWITGGLGGIGLTLAGALAREARAKLALVSRSGLPPRERWDELCARLGPTHPDTLRIGGVRALEQAGAEVELVRADVTDLEALAQGLARVERRFGPLNGVIHAAGTLADAPLAAKTQEEIERVFTPKVHGTLVLEQLLAGRALDFVALCSSTSARVGFAGQVDYAAANCFLDAFARSRARSQRVLSLGWGVWSEVGLAARAAEGRPREDGLRASHPWLDSVHAEPSGALECRARWTARASWVLDEHRTAAGEALLPGTGYLELARAALREAGEDARSFELTDLVFQSPLAVGEDEARLVRVRLEPRPAGYALRVESEPELEHGHGRGHGHGARALHAEARLRLLAPEPARAPAARDGFAPLRTRRAAPGTSLRAAQERHLRFGSRWGVLRALELGAEEARAELELEPRFAAELADFALHPALLDLATSAGLELVPGYEPDELWVPLAYARVRVHGALSARLTSRVRLRSSSEEHASFDVELAARADGAAGADGGGAGRVLLEIEGFTMRRVRGGALRLEAREAAGAPELGASGTAQVGAGEARELSPGELALRHDLARGIRPAEGVECFRRALALGEPELVVSSLALDALERQAAAVSAPRELGVRFERPDAAGDFLAPRDALERALAELWQELLGLERVGVRDSFFDLGGHSLIAVRLFARLKKAYQVDWPISVLFEAPTIEACAERMRAAGAESAAQAGHDARQGDGLAPAPERPRFTHLVAMHAPHAGRGEQRAPFFLVAGMFGNVLNLRHLAHLVGAERRFYGLQARGLFGDCAPHESFEEMARDYLAELRQVQAHGPYLLGGFSGGGITAWEMARQLREAGEEVAALVLLDTPLPQAPRLSAHEKVRIHLQRVRRRGAGYLAEWARERVRWELERRRAEEGERKPGEFDSAGIEAAFRRALERYRLVRWPGRVTLLRPKLAVAHVLGPERRTNAEREILFHDNGWGPHCAEVEVHEVPGDHDGMVLEPNVRVLAAKLRRVLEEAERCVPRRV